MKDRILVNFAELVQSSRYSFRFAANKCFPRYVRPPFPRNLLHEIRKTDPDQNALHSPPVGERIDLYSVWAIEFYTPSQMDELIRSLDDLDWNKEDGRDPVSWLKLPVTSKFSQGWMPLGPIISHDDPTQYVTRPLRAELPDGVLCAYGDIYRFTPSLVGIVFEFTFAETQRRSLEEALRQERETFVTATPSGYRIHEPGNQRTSQIRKIREDTTGLVTQWFSKNIPGLCSAGLLDGDFPTGEFVTLLEAKPFPAIEERQDGFKWYLNHLGLAGSYGSWESKRISELRFRTPSANRNAKKHHSIFSMNEVGWLELDSQEDIGDRSESRIYRMHRRLSGTFGIWAIGVLLEGYAQHFVELRNSQFMRSGQRKSAVEALRRIGENVLFSGDVAAVTEDLASLMRNSLPLGIEVESFITRPDAPDFSRKGSFEKLIHKQVKENAEWLGSVDDAVRHHLTQYGTILGIVENISLQTKVTSLSYALVALTVVLSVLTFVTASEHLPSAQRVWNLTTDFLNGLVANSRLMR